MDLGIRLETDLGGSVLYEYVLMTRPYYSFTPLHYIIDPIQAFGLGRFLISPLHIRIPLASLSTPGSDKIRNL